MSAEGAEAAAVAQGTESAEGAPGAPPHPEDILVHRVIARLNVGGPAMHVVLLTRAFDGRTACRALRPGAQRRAPRPGARSGRARELAGPSSAAPRAGAAPDAARPRFRARLLAGSVLESEGDMEYFARERGAEVVRIETLSRTISPLRDLRTLLELLRIFRRERPRVVHTHTAKAGTLGRIAAALAGVPVRIHTYHGHVLGGDYFGARATRFFLGVERVLARLSHRLVVLSEGQLEEMSGALGVAPREKFSVVPLGLDLEPFVEAAEREGARAESRDRLGLDMGDRVVGIVGRLVPIKNHELLFDAVELLRRREAAGEVVGVPTDGEGAAAPGGTARSGGGQASRLRIVVVGSGERETELRAYARERGLDDVVSWLGWRRDLPGIYPALDAVALPSRDEGTPVALIEALAAGVPVVARDVGGVSAVLQDGRWGRLVDSASPRALADSLASVLVKPPAVEERHAARRSVLERFGEERLARDLEEIYLEELDRASPTASPPIPWA